MTNCPNLYPQYQQAARECQMTGISALSRRIVNRHVQERKKMTTVTYIKNTAALVGLIATAWGLVIFAAIATGGL